MSTHTELKRDQDPTGFDLPDAAVERAADGSYWLVGCRSGLGQVFFPPLDVCPDTFEPPVERVKLSRVGTLYAYSTVHIGPKGFRTPYIIGYVDLPEGVRIFTHIPVEVAVDLAPDMPMSLCVFAAADEASGELRARFCFTPNKERPE